MKVKSSLIGITYKNKGFVSHKSKLVKKTNFKSSNKKVNQKRKIELGVKKTDTSSLNVIKKIAGLKTHEKKLGFKKHNKKLVTSKSTSLEKNNKLIAVPLDNAKGKKVCKNEKPAITNLSSLRHKRKSGTTTSVNQENDPIPSKPLTFLDPKKVTGAVSGIFKLLEENASKKTFLDSAQLILLQVECVKIPISQTKQLRFELPHSLMDHSTDVLLIVADKKGSKIYPEKAEEHYTELLKKSNVDFIQKVMPIRQLRQEYFQYEMRRKLVDRYDMILVDAKVSKCIPRLLGNFVLYKRKMPITVHLDRKDLRAHLERAVANTQMTVKSSGHCSTALVGTSEMSAEKVAANIVAVSGGLAKQYPGGWPNVRCLRIRSTHGQALPIYLSLVSSNSVKIPVEKRKKRAGVEGELSTMMDTRVLVRPDGTIVLKKQAPDQSLDDEADDEIIQEAEKYRQSAKTVRYDESDDDDNEEVSDKEADAITAAVEDELLNEYSLRADGIDEEEDEDKGEGEESSEDEDIPTLGKKRKIDNKKQGTKSTPNKKQKKGPQQQKQQKNKGNKLSAEGGVKKRGIRGGKKNKMNKNQRKAVIKRRKAGIK